SPSYCGTWNRTVRTWPSFTSLHRMPLWCRSRRISIVDMERRLPHRSSAKPKSPSGFTTLEPTGGSMTNRTPVRPGRRSGPPRVNLNELVTITVAGRIADALMRTTPYRIGQDGGLRVLPGTGGIVISHRVGDRCVGLAADHIEP